VRIQVLKQGTQNVCKHTWTVAGVVIGSRQMLQSPYTFSVSAARASAKGLRSNTGPDMVFGEILKVWCVLWDGGAKYAYIPMTAFFICLWKVSHQETLQLHMQRIIFYIPSGVSQKASELLTELLAFRKSQINRKFSVPPTLDGDGLKAAVVTVGWRGYGGFDRCEVRGANKTRG
jgi:hypothetical protein